MTSQTLNIIPEQENYFLNEHIVAQAFSINPSFIASLFTCSVQHQLILRHRIVDSQVNVNRKRLPKMIGFKPAP